ncbi:MAG: hypothetical protein FWB72_05435 [Firmicutes bacterium]|nr:hypothetical protein [Bacillota bacterium]
MPFGRFFNREKKGRQAIECVRFDCTFNGSEDAGCKLNNIKVEKSIMNDGTPKVACVSFVYRDGM